MSFPRYPKYKDSGVEWLGQVPEHWEVMAVKRGYYVFGGSTPKSDIEEFWDGDIPWATPADLRYSGIPILVKTQRTITEEGLASCGTTLVPEGSVLLSTRAPVGSLAIAGTRLCTNQGCKSLVAIRDANTRFLAYVLSICTTVLESRAKGTTFLELSGDELGAFKCPLPSKGEQDAIASFLDRETGKIDALVSEQERLIELLREKRQAVISHAVTKGLDPNVKLKDSGVEWLGKVPEHWIIQKLGGCCNTRGGSGFPEELQCQEGMELPFFKVGNLAGEGNEAVLTHTSHTISREAAEALRATIFPTGAIVFAKVGAALLLKRFRMLAKDSCIDNNMMGLTHNSDWDSSFLMFSLPLLDFDLIVNPGAVPSINERQFSSIRVARPPIQEQRAIVAHLTSTAGLFDSLIASAEQAIDLLRERRAALISAAVTGQIDVRNV